MAFELLVSVYVKAAIIHEHPTLLTVGHTGNEFRRVRMDCAVPVQGSGRGVRLRSIRVPAWGIQGRKIIRWQGMRVDRSR